MADDKTKRPEDERQPSVEGLTDPSEAFPHEDLTAGSEGSGRNVGVGGYHEAEGTGGHRPPKRRDQPKK